MNIKTADRLLELRKANGYSQEALAEKIGVSRQAISKWERGESSPDTDNLIVLANVYGITLDELLDGEKAVKQSVQDEKKQKENKPKRKAIYGSVGKALFKFPFPLVLVAIYVGMNLFVHLWHPSWIIFLLLPIYYHFAGACCAKSKKGFLFALPVPEVIILLYLSLGFSFSVWGQGALLFIIIPIYYWVVAFYKNTKE